MKINMQLLPMKGHFFFLNAGLAPLLPFLPTMAKDLGFSAFIVGAIFTIVPLVSIVIKPILGGIADKYQCQKSMFLVLLIIQMTFLFCINWIPPLPPPGAQLVCDKSNFTLLEFCSIKLTEGQFNVKYPDIIQCKIFCVKQSANEMNNLIEDFDIKFKGADIIKVDYCIKAMVNFTSYDNCEDEMYNCKVDCNETSLNKLSSDPSVSDDKVYYYSQFWLLLCFIVIGKVANTVITSVGDTICMNLLGDRPNDFGLQRLWSSVGWGLLAGISGIIVDQMSEGKENKQYSIAFYISICFLIFDILLSSTLQYKAVTKLSSNIVSDTIKALVNRDNVIFLFWCAINGVFVSLISNFLFWFLEEVAINNGYNLVWIKSLEGITISINCFFGEIPFFFFSGWIIKKIGHRNCMTLVLAAFSTRFLFYSYLTNPWWTLPVETLHGITYGIFYSTMVTYSSSVTLPGTETTVQNFVSSLYDCVGMSIGSLSGGYLIQKIGSSMTFWYLGLIASTLTVMHTLYVLLTNSQSTEKTIITTHL